jgi:PBSX family phage terminase large subunit
MSSPAKVQSGFNFQTNDFALHKFQQEAWDALEDEKIREVALLAGIQSGKTSFGALATTKKIGVLRNKHKDCNFIVAADTYKTLSQSTVPTLLKFTNQGLGIYNQQRQEIELKGGGKIYLRTSTDPWSVEGIPNCAFAWVDESGKCSKLFQTNILGRVARLSGQALYTSTPYAMNWLYHDVEKPFLSGERKDIHLVRFSSADNPSFPREEFERQRQILDSRMFRMKYMGVHERMQGLVYETPDDVFVEADQLPKNTRYFAGVDWGFAQGHEFAIVVRAITIDGYRYEVDEYKSAGLDPQQQVDACKAKAGIWGIERFFCDPARPDMIASMNKAGLKSTGFHVGNESYKPLIPGINKHYELIKSGKYKIWRSKCPHLTDELETYHWPEYHDDKEPKEVPVAINDHCLDAARYLTIGTMNICIKDPPKAIISQRFPERDFWNPAKKSKQKKSWDAY